MYGSRTRLLVALSLVAGLVPGIAHGEGAAKSVDVVVDDMKLPH